MKRRWQPTPEELRRRAIADALFEFHNQVNIIISRTAFRVIEKGEPSRLVAKMQNDINMAYEKTTAELEKFMLDSPSLRERKPVDGTGIVQ